MNTPDTFGRNLSRWLGEDAEHRVPDHLAEVLVRTAATRQRPWWSSPERWLPVQTTLRLAPVPRVPVLLLVVGALVLAIAAAAAFVGSRPRPAPVVGIAQNGPIINSEAGDLSGSIRRPANRWRSLPGRTMTSVHGSRGMGSVSRLLD